MLNTTNAYWSPKKGTNPPLYCIVALKNFLKILPCIKAWALGFVLKTAVLRSARFFGG